MNTVESWLAVYGAVLSTILAVVTLVNQRRDRAHLNLSLDTARRRRPGGSLLLEDVLLEVTNVGRRPVTIMLCAIRRKNDKRKHVLPDFRTPVLLQEGEVHKIVIPVRSLIPVESLTSILVRDNTHREWDVSRKELQRVISSEVWPDG